MILLGNFLAAIAKMLDVILIIYMWVVIIRAVLSWVNVPSFYPLTVVLYRLTEPVLRPLRRIVPPNKVGGVDITPIIVIIIILFIDSFIVKSLFLYAHQLLGGFRR